MVKIGRLKLETSAPDEERLLSSTGLSVAEMRAQLDGPCHAGTLAAALDACVDGGPHRTELAERIAAEGVEEVRPQVARLYANPKEDKGGKA